MKIPIKSVSNLECFSINVKKAIKVISERSKTELRNFSPYDNEPYWYHLVRVEQKLSKLGENDEEILVAAILHDSIEDNHLEKSEIVEFFPNLNNTIQIVELLSETEYSDHNNIHNRNEYFQNILNYPQKDIRLAAIKIKTIDRWDNQIGASFTNFTEKKNQYLDEYEYFFKRILKELPLKYTELINDSKELMVNSIEKSFITSSYYNIEKLIPK